MVTGIKSKLASFKKSSIGDLESQFKHNNPYSEDLSKRKIDNLSFEGRKQEVLDEFTKDNLEKIVKNIGSFIEIGKEQDIIRENFISVLGEDFFEENFYDLENIFNKEDNKKVLDELKNIENIENIENRDILTKVLLKNLEGDGDFTRIVKTFLENTEEFQDKIEEYKKIILNTSLNEDLKYNVFGGFFSGKNKWKNGGDVSIKEKLKTYKLPIFTSILAPIAIMDINGGTLISSSSAEIPPAFFTNPVNKWGDLISGGGSFGWDLSPVHAYDGLMNIVYNYDVGNISGGDIVFYGGESIIELGLAVLFSNQIGKLISGGNKVGVKSIGKLILTGSLLLGSVSWTSGLQALGQGVAAEKEKLHVSYFDKTMRYSNFDNQDVEGKHSSDNKKTISEVIDSIQDLVSIVPDMYSVYGREPVDFFDSEEVLNNLIKDINSRKLNNVGLTGDINKYIDQVKNIGSLDGLYKSIFQNILNEIKGNSPSGDGLGIEAYWKIKVLLISSGRLEGNNFDDQVINFINGIYKDGNKAQKVIEFVLKNKELTIHRIKENKKEIAYSSIYKNGDYKKISGKLPFETLSESQERFESSNVKILQSYIKEINDYVRSAEKEGVENLKISEFNLIIRNFNLFVEKKLKLNFEKYIKDINGKKDGIIGLYKNRDYKKSVQLGNKKDYIISNADSKKYDNSLRLNEIKEKYIDIDMIISQYEEDIEKSRLNGGSAASIENSVSTGNDSFIFNVSYITIYLLGLLASIKFGYRELEDGRKLDHKEFKEFRDEEFDKIEDRIKNIFNNLKHISKGKSNEISIGFKSFEELKTISINEKRAKRSLDNLAYYKEQMKQVLNKD